MRPVATDGVEWSVCQLVCHDREPCKNEWIDRAVLLFWMWTWVGPRKHVLDGVQIPMHEGAILRAKGAGPGHAIARLVGSWNSQSDSAGGRTAMARMLIRGVLDGGAHRAHLVNMTEPSVCGSSAAVCHITLAACLRYILINAVNLVLVDKEGMICPCPW